MSIRSDNELYLDKHHIEFYLKDAIFQLHQLTDEKVNAASFLADYFFSVHKENHVLFREYSFVKTTSLNKKCFIKSVWSCFRNVALYGSELLSVKEYHSLVLLVCPDFPLDVIQKVAKIILMDDAKDCLIAFLDFLFTFQFQVFYEDFINITKSVYENLIRNNKHYLLEQEDNASSTTYTNGVETSLFFESMKICYKNKSDKVEFPNLDYVEEELKKTSKITLYEFLMSLSKNSSISKEIGVLPEKSQVFEGKDIDVL